MKQLNEKVAIITGAAMGMGLATAELFAEEGAKVIVADFNEEAGKAAVQEITAKGGTAERSLTFLLLTHSNQPQAILPTRHLNTVLWG